MRTNGLTAIRGANPMQLPDEKLGFGLTLKTPDANLKLTR